jgi:hypothetical protein
MDSRTTSREVVRVNEVDASRFEQYLTLLWEQLTGELLGHSAPPDGVGELFATHRRIGYVVAREACFAAWQWQEDDVLCESFFVRLLEGRARCGWRKLGPHVGESTDPAPGWLSELKPVPCRLRTGHPPSFVELVAVWSARGHVQLHDAQLLEAREELQAQLQYYRLAAGEQAEEARQLRARLRTILQNPRADTAQTESSESIVEEPPRDLSGLEGWARANAERITVLSRALNAAKRSLYAEPVHVYQALELLAGPYREYRTGQRDRAGFEEALNASGLRLAGSVGASVAGMHGEAYFVSHGKQRRLLEQHLLRGGGRDERYCLRVYFFWDDETRRAVVGWLPSHLNNSLT